MSTDDSKTTRSGKSTGMKRANFKPHEQRGIAHDAFKRSPGAGGKPHFDKSASKGRPADKNTRRAAPAAPKSRVQEKQKNSVSPARMAALRALYEVYYQNAYSNLALDKQLKTSSMSDEDKRLTTGIFYLCIENRKKLDYILEPFVKAEPDDIIKCILHIAAAQILFMDRIPPHAAVNEAVNQARIYKKDEASGFVNGVLRSLLRAKEAGELHLPTRENGLSKYLEIEYSASPFAVKTLIETFGEQEAEAIFAYKPKERYETLRPNLLRSSDEELEARLTAEGIRFEKSVVPHAYRVYRAGSLTSSEDYVRGLFSIQGESAILAALAVEPKRGMNVLDACAAPGGKAALMGELMQGSGRVYCWDVHDHRVELMKRNAARLGLDNLRCSERDASVLKPDFVKSMDAVLVDAPCSGLGVVADKPEIAAHLTQARLEELCDTQKRLLDTCSEYVRPGGRLVYSTCTLLPQENEERIHAFLLAHPDFRLDSDTSWLPQSLQQKCADGQLRLMQHIDGVEGFFIARMIRVR